MFVGREWVLFQIHCLSALIRVLEKVLQMKFDEQILKATTWQHAVTPLRQPFLKLETVREIRKHQNQKIASLVAKSLQVIQFFGPNQNSSAGPETPLLYNLHLIFHE
jgi:hypothetical protein